MCVGEAEGREGDILSCIAAINVNASNCRRGASESSTLTYIIHTYSYTPCVYIQCEWREYM